MNSGLPEFKPLWNSLKIDDRGAEGAPSPGKSTAAAVYPGRQAARRLRPEGSLAAAPERGPQAPSDRSPRAVPSAGAKLPHTGTSSRRSSRESRPAPVPPTAPRHLILTKNLVTHFLPQKNQVAPVVAINLVYFFLAIL